MTNIIERTLEGALSAPVKRKRNSTGQLRATAKRVAGGATEVMVKITGFGKGGGHVKAHLDYISRNGKLQIESDRGELFTGREQVKGFFADWDKDFADGRRHKNQRDTVHMVLSMPEGTDQESVRQAVRAFAKSSFGQNHEYVFALHTDEPHPHCHLTVKMLGFDGVRLNPRKADLQQWREGFAEKLRDEGVDAEATPRRSRGVVRKAEPSAIRHIERGDKTHPPRVPQVKAARIKEAALELSAEATGLPLAIQPWEAAMQARQGEIRRAWLAAAAELAQENNRITFNQKEARNERPDYEQILSDRSWQRQRAAALYQSGLAKAGRQAPPGTLASMRNLSGIGLVHNQRFAQVLLQPHASDRVGRTGSADPEMRRPGVSPDRAHSDAARLAGTLGGAAENQALAARIRGFVDAMPGIDTERHRLRRELAQRFTRKVEKSASPELGDQIRSEQHGKDLER